MWRQSARATPGVANAAWILRSVHKGVQGKSVVAAGGVRRGERASADGDATLGEARQAENGRRGGGT